MKKTLTLLALTTAALMPMMPLTANGGEDHFVQGITFQEAGNWNTATGWFDANKAWDVDGLQCWAATCSNMIAWWQTQNGYENVNLTSIWNEYRSTFVNDGGIIYEGVIWWLDGTGAGSENWQNHLKAGVTGPGGAHYTEYLDKGLVQRTGVDDIAIISSSVYDAAAFSKQLVAYIERGYCVGANFTKNSQGHAKTIWGVSCDDNGLITALYMSDSDDHARGTPDVAQIQIEPITTRYVDDTLRLALANSPNWSLESVVVLNSRLSNDTHYFNILDENNNIIMKQNVDGEGYTLKAETQEVNDIIYDGSRGEQAPERLLTVEADHSAKTVQVNATYGLNLLEVQQEVTLTVENVAGSGLLTKTGEGTLKLTDKDGGGKIAVQEGVLECGNGTLAEITLNGGKLQGGGKFNKVTVNGGTLAVGNAPDYQQYSGGGVLTLSQAALEFHIDGFNKEASKWNGYGWGSGTYSNLDMYGGQIYLMEDDRIDEINFYLGGSALEALLQDGSFTLGLITGIKNSYFAPDYADLAANTHFYVSSDAEAIAGTTWLGGEDLTNHFTVKYEYVQSYDWGPWQVNMVGTYTGVTPPAVPEPTTSTLSLLALASLCARRRRK